MHFSKTQLHLLSKTRYFCFTIILTYYFCMYKEVYRQKWNRKFQIKNFAVLKKLQIDLTLMNTQKVNLGHWNLSNCC